MKEYTINTPNAVEMNRFYIQAVMGEDERDIFTISPNKKTDKVSWKYKRSAIKAFITTIACKHRWYGYIPYFSPPYCSNIQLVDKETKEILCRAQLHSDDKFPLVPRYSITPIDPMAQEYYRK